MHTDTTIIPNTLSYLMQKYHWQYLIIFCLPVPA